MKSEDKYMPIRKMVTLFFQSIGVFAIISGLYVFFTNPYVVNSAPIEKYTVLVFCINSGVLLFILPYLARKGWVTLSYYQADDRLKAKTNLTLITLGAPGWILFLNLVFNKIDFYILPCSIIGLFIYYIISGAYILFFKEKE